MSHQPFSDLAIFLKPAEMCDKGDGPLCRTPKFDPENVLKIQQI